MEMLFLPYKDIDKKSWDECVLNSTKPLIYATSIYLDAMCDGDWDAIIAPDYSWVFPLPWRKKLTIKYVYQPAFIQQLGIFSKEELPPETALKCIELLQEKIKFAEYTFNAENKLQQSGYSIITRKNYLVSLGGDYERIHGGYTSAFKRNLQRVKKHKLSYKKSEDVPAVVNLYKDLYSERTPSVTENDYIKFQALCIQLQELKLVHIRQVFMDDLLLGATLLLEDENRYYSMMSCITPEGKKKRANYFLYDHIIREFAGTQKFLDLEGSDIPGIEAFFKTMGPLLETYPFLKYNHLPALVKLIKP